MNDFQGSNRIFPTVSLDSLSTALVDKYRARAMMWKLVAIKKKGHKKTTNRTVISILFSLTSISVTISLNKHNVQNHFLDLAGSEKLTATWKSCIMNVNICHLQVSHSQTLIQPRTGCGEGGRRRRTNGAEERGRTLVSESETLGGGLTGRRTEFKFAQSRLIVLESGGKMKDKIV